MTARRLEARGTRRVVVSVHDVAPSVIADVRWLLARLSDLGALPRVLKVIPAEPGSDSLAMHPDLVELLQAEAGEGTEMVLHGWAHRASGPLRGPLTGRMRARLAAGDAAEFLALPPAAASARVAAGRAALRAIGLETTGFCAPAWLSTPELPGILAAHGFRYLVRFSGLLDLQTGSFRPVPATGYMGAGPVQERLVDVERALVMGTRRAFPVVRVFLHPAGARRSRSCRRTLEALETLLRERTPATYAQVLDA